jgi:hypothetical protein
MDVIPSSTPWGYAHNLPLTFNGVDIGEDFTDFDSHEACRTPFLREKRYDLVLT